MLRETAKGLIRELKKNREEILERGALVFDIDETLLGPDKVLESGSKLSRLLSLCRNQGFRLAVISGSPGAVVANRLVRPLCRTADEMKRDIRGLTVYVNGGSSKYLINEEARYVPDRAFDERHRIPFKKVEEVRTILESYIQGRLGFDKGTFRQLTVAWLDRRRRQWQDCRVEFENVWEGASLTYLEDSEMAAAKAGESAIRTSFPFINTRGTVFGSRGRKIALSGFTPTGFYPAGIDPRDRVLQKLGRELGSGFGGLVVRKAGRSSLDITGAGTDKVSAIRDFIETNDCDTRYVYYFGDEFYTGGNDAALAQCTELTAGGIHLLALNRDEPPASENVSWIGRGPEATLAFLEEVLE